MLYCTHTNDLKRNCLLWWTVSFCGSIILVGAKIQLLIKSLSSIIRHKKSSRSLTNASFLELWSQ